MDERRSGDPLHPPRAMFEAVAPDLLAQIHADLEERGESDIACQLGSLAVATQKVGGTREAFSLYVYPLPVPPLEERMRMAVHHERTLVLAVANGRVTLDIDVLGRICFMHFDGVTHAYDAFVDLLGHVSPPPRSPGRV